MPDQVGAVRLGVGARGGGGGGWNRVGRCKVEKREREVGEDIGYTGCAGFDDVNAVGAVVR